MFDNLKGMASLAGVMQDLPRLKMRFEEVRDRLAAMEVDGETGGGAVRAVASGKLEIKSITVEPSLIAGLVSADRPDDRALAEELIVGAVNQALAKAREAAEAELRGAAEELGLPLPPGGLGDLL